jgi:hypothetical protein
MARLNRSSGEAGHLHSDIQMGPRQIKAHPHMRPTTAWLTRLTMTSGCFNIRADVAKMAKRW